MEAGREPQQWGQGEWKWTRDVLKDVFESQLRLAPWSKQVSCVCHSHRERSLKRFLTEAKEIKMLKTVGAEREWRVCTTPNIYCVYCEPETRLGL